LLATQTNAAIADLRSLLDKDGCARRFTTPRLKMAANQVASFAKTPAEREINNIACCYPSTVL
jgi:hypothetical protein